MSILRRARKVYTYAKEFGLVNGCSVWIKVNGGASGSVPLKVHSKSIGQFVNLRPKDSDITVFEMTFLSQEYRDPSAPHRLQLEKAYAEMVEAGETPVIIDCGANIGMSAIWFAKQYPSAKIVAIEPEPDNFKLLEANTQNFDNIDAVQAGISNERGRLNVFNAGDGAWGFQVAEDAAGPIELITIQDALNRVPNGKLFIVKVDIEGFEDKLFESNTGWISDAAMIVVESHDWMFPWRQTAKAINFTIFQTGDWDQVQRGENLFFYAHKFLKPA